MKETLSACPACSGRLEIRSYTCTACGTEVQGRFSGCTFCRMPDEDRYFCLVFLQCEGNMKDVEKVMGISYPTIKNRLAQIRSALGTPVQSPDSGGNRRENPAGGDREKVREVLRTLEQGEIAFDKALDLIKGGQTKGEGS